MDTWADSSWGTGYLVYLSSNQHELKSSSGQITVLIVVWNTKKGTGYGTWFLESGMYKQNIG